MIGAKRTIFLIVDRKQAHLAKKTKDYVESLGGALQVIYLPPYAPDKLVRKHVKADAVGQTVIIRRIATRYDRLARNFLASVDIVAVLIWWV
jgi:transposase